MLFSIPLSMPLGLKHLLSYQSAWLRGDVLAGLTVAAYLIPQCMAYWEVAGSSLWQAYGPFCPLW